MTIRRSIRGGAERGLRERKRTVRRLSETPEKVTRAEAREFLDWVRADFQAFVKRQKLYEVKGGKKNSTRTGRRVTR
jgi:hypothetical protein